jgi:hypothetical protein
MLERWINPTNIMLPKKNGSHKVTDYRNIHIYECNMNATLSLKWKEALKKSEEQNVIIPSQVGSRKQRSLQFPIHIEISQLEISRITRKEYGQINYDAKTCYDRILPNIAAMSSLVHRVNDKIVSLHNNLLLKMKYNVMIEGASREKTFHSTDETKIYGTGQGCGNSPIIWLFISNILIQMFSSEAIGAKYIDNNHTETLEVKISAYVDDINTHHNCIKTHPNIITNMQNDFTIWKNLLDMSGGALSQQKCNFYILSWDFTKSGIPISKETYIEHLSLQGIGWDIPRVEKSHQTLGYSILSTNPIKTQQKQWQGMEKR